MYSYLSKFLHILIIKIEQFQLQRAQPIVRIIFGFRLMEKQFSSRFFQNI